MKSYIWLVEMRAFKIDVGGGEHLFEMSEKFAADNFKELVEFVDNKYRDLHLVLDFSAKIVWGYKCAAPSV